MKKKKKNARELVRKVAIEIDTVGIRTRPPHVTVGVEHRHDEQVDFVQNIVKASYKNKMYNPRRTRLVH